MVKKLKSNIKFGFETEMELNLVAAFKYIDQKRFEESDKIIKQYLVPGRKILLYEGKSDYLRKIVSLDKKLFEPVNKLSSYASLTKIWMPMEFENKKKTELSYELNRRFYFENKSVSASHIQAPKVPDMRPGSKILLLEYLTSSNLFDLFDDFNKRINNLVVDANRNAKSFYNMREGADSFECINKPEQFMVDVKENMLEKIINDFAFFNLNPHPLQQKNKTNQNYEKNLSDAFNDFGISDKKLKNNLKKISKLYKTNADSFFWDVASWNVLIDYSELVENLKKFIDVPKELSDSIFMNRYDLETINNFIFNEKNISSIGEDNIKILFKDALYHIDFDKANRISFLHDDFSHITDLYGNYLSINSDKDINEENIANFLVNKYEADKLLNNLLNSKNAYSKNNLSSKKDKNLLNFYRPFRHFTAKYVDPLNEYVVKQGQVLSNLYLILAKNDVQIKNHNSDIEDINADMVAISESIDVLKLAYLDKKFAVNNIAYLLKNIDF